jgi:hypothetical protein
MDPDHPRNLGLLRAITILSGAAVLKTSRSILTALRLTLRAQPRSKNSKLGRCQELSQLDTRPRKPHFQWVILTIK